MDKHYYSCDGPRTVVVVVVVPRRDDDDDDWIDSSLRMVPHWRTTIEYSSLPYDGTDPNDSYSDVVVVADWNPGRERPPNYVVVVVACHAAMTVPFVVVVGPHRDGIVTFALVVVASWRRR